MAKKTAYPLIHLLAFLASPLLFVACSHAPTEEIDGLAEVNKDGTALLAGTAETQELVLGEELPDSNAVEIEAAVKKLKGRKHKKVLHPFSDPTAMERPTSAPARELVSIVKPVSQAVVRNGSTLNRYYFMRAGDTPEMLSKLFYGSADRSAELVEWNGPAAKWEAGKVLYYRSGRQADDTTLLSFYKEAGIVADEVRMLPGDTLRTIASQRYGSQDSWREIAALNGMRSERDTSVAVLKMYPFPLVKDAEAPQLAESKPVAKEAKLASASISTLVQKHPGKMAAGVVGFVLVAGFLFIQRRRYRSRFDF